jgi:NAD(P)-dependent dehydrogenase (short-subunit alcohol dehydrogenase family)
MGRLQDKVAFITGAGSGIARAAAHLFTREGAKVVIAEIKPELGRASEQSVRAAGGDATFVETDVTKEDSVQRAIQQTVARYGKLDVLYNCAGGSIVEDTRVTDVDMSVVWNHTQSLDLLGTFLCCRHGIPEIIKAGGGAIINMSSVVALRGAFPIHVYTAAKGAIIALTKSLAGTYALEGIRVNAICPGVVLTDRVKQRFGENMDQPATVPQTRAIKIDWKQYPFATGQPDDIANIALFLASDEARMITGASIPGDGGLSAY